MATGITVRLSRRSKVGWLASEKPWQSATEDSRLTSPPTLQSQDPSGKSPWILCSWTRTIGRAQETFLSGALRPGRELKTGKTAQFPSAANRTVHLSESSSKTKYATYPSRQARWRTFRAGRSCCSSQTTCTTGQNYSVCIVLVALTFRTECGSGNLPSWRSCVFPKKSKVESWEKLYLRFEVVR